MKGGDRTKRYTIEKGNTIVEKFRKGGEIV
jgi:hypothetical protein